MAFKHIDSDFLEINLDVLSKNMETPPFAEISRRLDFPFEMHIEKEAYQALIKLPDEEHSTDSILAFRWNNILTEIAALRVDGNYVVPQTFSVSVQGLDGVTREKQADMYICANDDGTPYMLITTPKGRFDFLNSTVQ